MSQNTIADTIKVNQTAFIWDLVIKKALTKYNIIILIKASSSIEMTDLKNYKKVNLHTYQQLIGKLIYFTNKTKPNIAFTIG